MEEEIMMNNNDNGSDNNNNNENKNDNNINSNDNNNNKKKKKKLVSLLFIGQTGVGKTTLIYALRDFLQNKPFEKVQKTQQEEKLQFEKEGLIYNHGVMGEPEQKHEKEQEQEQEQEQEEKNEKKKKKKEKKKKETKIEGEKDEGEEEEEINGDDNNDNGHNGKNEEEENNNNNNNEAGASRTREPYSIIIKDHPDYDVVLIDSPGIGDTNGKKQDEINWSRTANFIQSSEFNAIVFVVGNQNNRATSDFQYVVNELKKNFESLFQDHFIMVVTRCSNLSKQTGDALRGLGLPTKHKICINNEPYDEKEPSEEMNEGNSDDGNNDEENRNIYVHNQTKFIKILDCASNFKLFQGSILADYRRKRAECMSKWVKCEGNLKNIEEEATELDTVKKNLSIMTEEQAIIYLGSLEKKEKVWIEIKDKIQMYCLRCKHSCHAPCLEVTSVMADIHQCCCFNLSRSQLIYKDILETTSYVVRPRTLLIGAVVGAVAGAAIGGVMGEPIKEFIRQIPKLNEQRLSAVVGGCLGVIGQTGGQGYNELLLRKARTIYQCHECHHTAQDHVFLNHFPQDRLIKQNLRNQADIDQVLDFLSQQKEQLLGEKYQIEQELDAIGESCPFMILPSK